MHDFLSWFPSDSALQTNCKEWACAFSKVNNSSVVGGHLANDRWGLFNFVHAGPPADATPPPIDDFEDQLLWSLQGLPDSWWVTTYSYSTIALAFEHLTKEQDLTSPDPTFSTLARKLNQGIWNARLNQASFLMPSTVTPLGVLPGDQEGTPGFRYMYDTDCLYWANGLYRTYSLFHSSPVTFLGLPITINLPGFLSPNLLLSLRIWLWRDRIAKYLASPSASFPDLYLAYALGVTIDWIRGGWSAINQQFRRKLFFDGTPVPDKKPYGVLYGDGKYNTLEMLVWAYRFTGDILFLQLFLAAWDKMMDVVKPSSAPQILPSPGVKPFFYGVMPYSITEGKLTDPYGNPSGSTDQSQDIFLNLVVQAYEASQAVGSPNAGLLTRAETLADRLIELACQGYGSYVLKKTNGLGGSAFMALARARGALRRIAMNMSSPGQTLTIGGGGVSPLVVNVPANKSRAVIYMDVGTYTISWSAGTKSITVATDEEIPISRRNVRFQIKCD